jgi:hypothetical protein
LSKIAFYANILASVAAAAKATALLTGYSDATEGMNK